MQSSAESKIQFLVLAFITRECVPKILELLHLHQRCTTTSEEHWTRFLKNGAHHLWKSWFSFQRCHVHKAFNACLTPDWEEANKTELSAKSNWLFLHFQIVTHSSSLDHHHHLHPSSDCRIAVLRTSSIIETPLIFRANLIWDACICDYTLSVIT